MSKLIVANWKMNGSLTLAHDYAWALTQHLEEKPIPHTLVVCPPVAYTSFMVGRLVGASIAIGAQDCSTHKKGAYTGEISCEILKDIGCTYVLIGHSECRQNHQETEETLAAKMTLAYETGLIPIYCIGETQTERDAGKTKDILAQHLSFIDQKPLIIAYEPVWAIGTGRIPQDSEIQEAVLFIHDRVSRATVLYGGSVTAKNAGAILSLPGVDGVLVGGASLNPHEFWHIVTAV
jgi:triosephosphate isomerase